MTNLATTDRVDTIVFDRELTFAERWAILVQAIYPNRKRYIDDFEAMLFEHGLGRDKRVLDTCAGEGLPALDLLQRGWQVDALDASPDMIEVYNHKAAELGLQSRCHQATWMDLPGPFPGGYDLLICHGNTFSHAPGGWNRDEMDFPDADRAYMETLKRFHALLAPGGYLYVDKSRDHDAEANVEHREPIARLSIRGRSEELSFQVEYPRGLIRRASFLCTAQDGTETRLSNTAPLLPTPKLKRLLHAAGFTCMEPVTIASETPYFQGWMVRT